MSKVAIRPIPRDGRLAVGEQGIGHDLELRQGETVHVCASPSGSNVLRDRPARLLKCPGGFSTRLKMTFDRMDINIWEVIEAAKTKPFGFKAFYPRPGLGSDRKKSPTVWMTSPSTSSGRFMYGPKCVRSPVRR